MSGIVGRLAPSPTGGQHLGNARTYLLAWLSARCQSGKIILRMEDIDSPRIKGDAAEQAIDDLRWLGLDWDIGPIVQSTRLRHYQAALDELKAKELVYPCTCTRKDIEQAASAPHLEHELPPYPGLCAHRSVADAALITDKPFAWRFRSTTVPGFEDVFAGWITPRPEYGGDFVVWKNNNTPAYQLAVVVDDVEMGVTEVIRGDDLIPSTPRQLQLYRALGKQPPRFSHIPLVTGTDGRRLAKRHGDARLASYRAQGVSAEQVLGYLAMSCGWQRTPAPTTLTELLKQFTWDTVPHQAWVVDELALQFKQSFE
ncbi:MAG: tRNA glutamyl-Q(34) synthetase GluQRS [Gemmatales bacterium]